uniref:TIR domain-containing protein n=1 Tax=Magallana gigas TaxID=29159 RepID=A0A8W8JAD4_MAGGI
MMKWKKTRGMLDRQLCVSVVLMYRLSPVLTQICSISNFVDDCGNKGLLWNCSGLNISKIPTVLPPELENINVMLDLSVNQFTSLTEDTFEAIATSSKSLLRDQKQSLTEINLDHNMFSSIYDSLIQLENLNNLYLRYNLISKISEKDQRHFESLNNLSIYIEGNPISCACLNIQSLKWMKDHQNSFPDLGNVLCLENNHHVGHLFNDEIWRKFELDCQSKDWLIFSIVLLFLTILAFTSIVAIKNYRVHLEYVILRLKKQWKGIPLRKSEEEFLFDVYVSYSESDYVWVRDKLCPKLEDLNVKSWITDMNSTPGRWVLEGIVNRINECRKVMFVVSESFLDMEWSSYAVKTAITHAFHNQRQGFIVVLIKDGVALEKLPDELKNIWWCIEHFRWPEEESNEVILKKLTKALQSDLTF